MFIIKKNQIIITALVIMIAAAGYLNYIETNPAEPSEIVLNDEGDIMGLVPDDEIAAVNGINKVWGALHNQIIGTQLRTVVLF